MTVSSDVLFDWKAKWFECCCCLHQELQKGSSKKVDQVAGEKSSLESIQSSVPLFLQYPLPYNQDAPNPLLVSQSPSKLHFGNPYSLSDSKGWFPFKVSP